MCIYKYTDKNIILFFYSNLQNLICFQLEYDIKYKTEF